MIDPERPPLDPLIFEEIKARLHAVDQRHWPVLIAFQVPNFHPLNIPVPPQRPLQFREAVLSYALSRFDIEAYYYAPFRADFRYPPWLTRLAGRVVDRVVDALDKIEQGNTKSSLWFHGISQQEIVEAVRLRLWEISNLYISKKDEPQNDAVAFSDVQVSSTPQIVTATPSVGPPAVPDKRKRASASIQSAMAAKRMEAYIEAHGLGYTEFASKAHTTDKTLRTFRNSGKVRRDIFEAIAKAMGISKEELLKN
jgi:hypothetical protein